MNQENYNSIYKVVSNETFQEVKAIRIFKLFSIDEKITKEVLAKAIIEDIDFVVKVMGGATKILANTVNHEKSIIILEHSKKRTTHLSVNLYNKPLQENFKIEVVGESGILEYDNSKGSPIFLSEGSELKTNNLKDVDLNNYSTEARELVAKILEAF